MDFDFLMRMFTSYGFLFFFLKSVSSPQDIMQILHLFFVTCFLKKDSILKCNIDWIVNIFYYTDHRSALYLWYICFKIKTQILSILRMELMTSFTVIRSLTTSIVSYCRCSLMFLSVSPFSSCFKSFVNLG